MDKAEIRRRVRNNKCLIDANERARQSEAVFDMLERMTPFVMSEHILMYHSLPDELSTHAFIDKWHTRKHIYLPRVNGVDLEILPYDITHMHQGAYHIEEPDGENTVDIDTIDLIIVPGVAFDRTGNRVGRGKGFYDRLLCRSRATTIGVAYDFQIFDTVPADKHDIGVDYVLTSAGLWHK